MAFVARWKESRQSAHAFGKVHGVGAGNLIRWKEQQAQRAPARDAKMAFFPLQVLQKSVVKEGHQVVANIVVGKLSVQVLAGAQQDDVQRLMCALLAVQP